MKDAAPYYSLGALKTANQRQKNEVLFTFRAMHLRTRFAFEKPQENSSRIRRHIEFLRQKDS
jgi:hypothetical protein